MQDLKTEMSGVQTTCKVWILWPVSVSIPRIVRDSNLISSFKIKHMTFVTNLILFIYDSTPYSASISLLAPVTNV